MVAACNLVEEVSLIFVLLVDAAAVDDTDVVNGCLVDLTVRWMDCLLLLLAIEDDDGEEEVAVGVDLVSLELSFILSLSLFFDLHCRVDLLDCLVVVFATRSVDVMTLSCRLAVANDFDWLLLVVEDDSPPPLIFSARLIPSNTNGIMYNILSNQTIVAFVVEEESCLLLVLHIYIFERYYESLLYRSLYVVPR